MDRELEDETTIETQDLLERRASSLGGRGPLICGTFFNAKAVPEMQSATAQTIKSVATAAAHCLTFPPLALETRTAIPTEAAAYHLNRKPQTLRAWDCLENGPLRPVRISGRLSWRVADIQRVLAGEVL